MGNNKVSLIDRLLAVPLAIYFWWYGFRQKVGKHKKKSLINDASDSGIKSRVE